MIRIIPVEWSSCKHTDSANFLADYHPTWQWQQFYDTTCFTNLFLNMYVW